MFCILAKKFIIVEDFLSLEHIVNRSSHFMGNNSVGPPSTVFGFEDLEIAIKSRIMPFAMDRHFGKDPFEPTLWVL